MEILYWIGGILLCFFILGFILHFGGRLFGIGFSKSFFKEWGKEKKIGNTESDSRAKKRSTEKKAGKSSKD